SLSGPIGNMPASIGSEFRSALLIVLHKADKHNTNSIKYFEADVYPSICHTLKKIGLYWEVQNSI
ncbi:hypothetical protein, partial [Faecalicatena orotica]|uniref:hypothetical protein n=1 Tax=Faecalicatena orotica TaxID=1544 RepID=UPI001A9A6D34